MGNVDGVPVASQVKSIVQITKGDAAGAWDTQNKFSQKCLGAAQVRSIIEALRGDVDAAADTQKRFLENARQLLDTSEDPSNLVDVLPVVSQLKSTACLVEGRHDEAASTQRNFTRHCPVVSQGRSLLEVATGRPDEAVETQKAFVKFTSRAFDKVPLLGHAKALIHQAAGERERGEQAMNEANRVTAKTSGLIGSALADIFMPGSSSSQSEDPWANERMITNAEPLTHPEIVQHTLCLNIAPEQVQSHRACPICMQDFHEGEMCTTLRCFHLFHTDCCTKWLGQSGNCPVCRVPVKPIRR